MKTKILITGVVLPLVSVLVLGLLLFIAAGTVFWLYGWVFLILLYSWAVALLMWLLRYDPGLIEERTGFKPNQSTWDKAYIVLGYSLSVISFIVMPLDAVRFHWSQMPTWLHVVGAIVLLLSFYLIFLIYRENPYLSSAVHVQEERGQTVVSTGPYRYVRHPLYTSALLFFLGSALLLGSWIGVLLGLVFEGMLAIRAVREEQVLLNGLKGYDAYMAQVRWRLIPRVW
ncbi:MAG TPA: isoprenylcysteine carboxylmethyltransferase family protein [Candidatus Bathyarchaeia archaeon]|nr:isoprenylcysteine carboxylmethyltransferase family protein [Candidatus Bathyarchaeia archaeon]